MSSTLYTWVFEDAIAESRFGHQVAWPRRIGLQFAPQLRQNDAQGVCESGSVSTLEPGTGVDNVGASRHGPVMTDRLDGSGV